MEDILNVKVHNFNGWFSSFMVDDSVIVETVDIYTYKCTACKNNLSCQHAMDVRRYIDNELDKSMKEDKKNNDSSKLKPLVTSRITSK